MTVVAVRLGTAALVDWPTVLLALVASVLLLRYHLNSAWLVLGSAALGWMVFAWVK
jgi:chromate transporter